MDGTTNYSGDGMVIQPFAIGSRRVFCTKLVSLIG